MYLHRKRQDALEALPTDLIGDWLAATRGARSVTSFDLVMNVRRRRCVAVSSSGRQTSASHDHNLELVPELLGFNAASVIQQVAISAGDARGGRHEAMCLNSRKQRL